MNMNFSNWNDMFNVQKNMMEYWNKMFTPQAGGENGEKGNEAQNPFLQFSNYMEMYKMQQQFMENWNEWMKNFTNNGNMDYMNFMNPMQNMQKYMNAYYPLEFGKLLNSTANEVYDKMLKSNAFYLGLYDMWENINKNMLTPYSAKFKENMDEMLKQYDQTFMENFVAVLPDDVKNLVLSPYNYVKTVLSVYFKFFEPWNNVSLTLTDNLMEAILKDPNKVIDFLKNWEKTYDETFGKLATSPMVGSSKEFVEQNNKVVDALIDMIVNVSEYMGSILAVARENSRKAFADYVDMLEKGSQPKTFNEFFKFWSDSVEKAIETHFFTDEFSNTVAMTTDAYMKFKIEYDKYVEKFLAYTPVVTKSDVDSLYKTVYDLKKEIKALNKKIETLEGDASKPVK